LPAPLSSRDEAVQQISELFRRRGYDGTSLSDIAKATGLGKSSLYHYFPGGKEEMARAVLSSTLSWLRDEAAATLEADSEPKKRLNRALKAIERFYGGGKKLCPLGNLAVGHFREPFQRKLTAAFSTWIEMLTDLAVDAKIPHRIAEERAERAVVEIEGALILSAGLGDTGPFERALRRIPEILLSKQ
jgi:AcrR family transcriptional regulator